MEWYDAEGYSLGRLLCTRALALVYLVAFLVALNQFRALLGSAGLTPIPRFLSATSFGRAPSVFHLRYSDRLFAAVAGLGAVLAAATALGVTDRLPLIASMLVWFLMWLLYRNRIYIKV